MVGRKREQQKLNAAFQSKRAEFVGVFGRRRVGKTYLISESFAGISSSGTLGFPRWKKNKRRRD